MAAIGDFFVNIGSKFDAKGFTKARASINALAKNTAIAGGIIAAGLAFAIKKASEMEEATSKFETVFRGQTEAANAFAEELVDGYGMSTLAAKKNLSAIQDLLVPMGLNRKAATDLSGEIVKLSADLGSFNDMPSEQVMRDIQSALTGMVIPMKKYGVVLSAVQIKQEVMNQGWAKSVSEITPAMKAQATYNLIVAGSSDAIGDFQRTQAGFANQFKILTARLETFVIAIGAKFLPMATQMVGFITDRVLPVFEKMLTGTGDITTSLDDMAPTLQFIAKAFIGLGAVGQILIKTFLNIVRVVQLAILGLKGLKAVISGDEDAIIRLGVEMEKTTDAIKKSFSDIPGIIMKAGQRMDNISKQSAKVFIKGEKAKTDAAKQGSKIRIEAAQAEHDFKADLLMLSQESAQFNRDLQEEARIVAFETEEERDLLTMERRQTIMDATTNLLKNFFALKLQNIQNDTNDLINSENSQFDARRDFILKNVADETDRQRQLDLLEKEHAAKTNAIKLEGEKKERRIKIRQKRLSIAEAVINTAVGFTKALAQGGIFGAALGALVVAAGSVQIALIKAQSFAKGGLAKGPTAAIFGDAGPEVALPLHSPETVSALSAALAEAGAGGSGGGDTIVVNVNRPLTSRQEARRQGHIIGTEIFREVRRSRKI